MLHMFVMVRVCSLLAAVVVEASKLVEEVEEEEEDFMVLVERSRQRAKEAEAKAIADAKAAAEEAAFLASGRKRRVLPPKPKRGPVEPVVHVPTPEEIAAERAAEAAERARLKKAAKNYQDEVDDDAGGGWYQEGRMANIKIVDNNNGTYTVSYTLRHSGRYRLKVRHGGPWWGVRACHGAAFWCGD